MTLPRAADDFPAIRARMKELRHEHRAADDFATIRARMEELRRERARAASSAKPIRAPELSRRTASG